MGRVAEAVRWDPSLSAQFLRLANSSAFGARSTIVSLAQAVARLGTSQTRQIALLVTCQAGVFDSKTRRAAAHRLRVQSVVTALWAQEVARVRRTNVEEAFLSGLLGDVAMPALWQLAEDVERAGRGTDDAAESDAVIAGVHHAVGADIAHRWKLPARVVTAIRMHHASPEEITRAKVGPSMEATVAAVQLAGVLAAPHMRGESIDLEQVKAHPAVIPLSLYGAELEKLLEREEVVREAARVVT